MVKLIRSDLEFILAQIKVAEAHAAGRPLTGAGGLIPADNVSWGLRTVDGGDNNLLPGREKWGTGDQAFPELLKPSFRNGEEFDPPGPGGPIPTSYHPSNDPHAFVVDSSLRTISNLIVDQTVANPAAVQRFIDAGLGVLDEGGVLHHRDDAAPGGVGAVVGPEETLVIPNVAPDEGRSASFNSWFTLFGQFFDHGLDLVNKGQSGDVFIPLKPDDPLYDPDSDTNFMVLTRATVSPGPDGVMGTAEDVRPVNTTTSFVDQNQTYSSHASHQVFLREYVFDAAGRPIATGRLIEGADGGMATWAEVKAQAKTMLGIHLTDQDVGKVPLLRTDPYGEFIPGSNGFPQVVVGLGPDGVPNTEDDLVIQGDPTADGGSGVSLATAIRTAHAFLADIAHTAAPNGLADGDIEVGLDNGDGTLTDGHYDNELLEAHYIAGDGRVNENIGLIAVHHVFHAEHNRLVQHTKDVVLADAARMRAEGATQAQATAFLNEWLAADAMSVPTTPSAVDALVWDGERLFQAAKFVNEMQYQHLVFEEFARKVQPGVAEFAGPDGYDVSIDPTIVAEFAHVVYRFGHSMLNETIDRFDPDFDADHIGLIEGFLNPGEFDGGAGVSDHEMAGAVIRGMTRQVGAEIDEFVTGALRNNLLGLPLDLATINLARGRDVGAPSLNAARREFHQATDGAAELRPYESWTDFAANLKNEASIINFVAAYGLHPLITGESTLEGKRAAALAIIFGADQAVRGDPDDASDDRVIEAPADAVAFLNSTGAWSSGPGGATTTGLDDVDFWIGGLAEKLPSSGGMLGSTFNFVFQTQMEKLQNGDRFYYLQRLDGQHLFGELEGASFAGMIMRNTDATHLPSDVFSTPNFILEVDRSKQHTGLGPDGKDDPTDGSSPTPLVIRDDPSTPGADTGYLRYTGEDHVVLGGGDPGDPSNPSGKDTLIAGEGDDSLYGDGGDDRLEGGGGGDFINGGDGNDIIRDLDGDDNIKGGDGDDIIHAGPGLDLVLGGAGSDFVVLGADPGSEVFGGEGDDFIRGSKDAELIFGNEGDDWLESGSAHGAPGDNFDAIFAYDLVDGHDVFLGDDGFNAFIGEGGDDIMVGGPGDGEMKGMSGFDWATYKDSLAGVEADFLGQGRDTYEAVEGLSGSRFNDVLRGSDVDAATNGVAGARGSMLTSEGIARITGLQALLGAGATSFDAGDIILGGDGGDVIQGRGGNDVIDGDKHLNVRISVRSATDPSLEIESHKSMATLVDKMFSGQIEPGQLRIVREILPTDGAGDVDVAVYSGSLSRFSLDADGTRIFVTDTVGTEGADTLSGIEKLRFDGVDYAVMTGGGGGNFLNGRGGAQAIFGLGGRDSINGQGGDDLILGGGGNDSINGGGGADVIQQTGAADGRDVVNGGGGNDTYQLNGVAGAETFRIYTRAAAVNAGMSGLNASTEIVVTRNGTNNASIVAELDNIEEIRVNSLQVTSPGGAAGGPSGGDTVQVFGDFNRTSLNFSTITVHGGPGDDTVDITWLSSDHRIVFRTNGGDDALVGGVRPQDAIERPEDAAASMDPEGRRSALPVAAEDQPLLGLGATMSGLRARLAEENQFASGLSQSAVRAWFESRMDQPDYGDSLSEFRNGLSLHDIFVA